MGYSVMNHPPNWRLVLYPIVPSLSPRVSRHRLLCFGPRLRSSCVVLYQAHRHPLLHSYACMSIYHCIVWLGALLSVDRYASTVVYTHIDVLTEVINEDAERAFIDATGEQPLPGGRRVDTWSMCFQGGTFDRVKERCDSSLSVAVRHICAWTHKSVCIIRQLYRCRLTAYCIFHIMHCI